MARILVNGIVAYRDKEPYVELLADGKKIAQLTMADARKIALDILEMAYRTEADAMIWRFFTKNDLSEVACAALMKDFREFRYAHDTQTTEGSYIDPDTGRDVP